MAKIHTLEMGYTANKRSPNEVQLRTRMSQKKKDEHWPWVATGCLSGCSGAASVFVMICVAGIFLL